MRRRTVSAAFVRWTRKSRWRVVARRGIESHEWLPDGRLVLLQRRHGRSVIKVISRAGDRRSFRARGRPNRRLLVTRDGTIAFGGLEGRLQLFDARGRTRRVLKTTGWFVTGVAPRGDRFVLVERDGNRLAVREPSGEIRPIGRINPAYTIAVVEWEA